MYNLVNCLQPNCRILLSIIPDDRDVDYSKYFDFVSYHQRSQMITLAQGGTTITVSVRNVFSVDWDEDDQHSISCTRHTLIHYKNGVHHRTDGPAVLHADGREEFWIEGKYYDPGAYKMALFTLHKQKVN